MKPADNPHFPPGMALRFLIAYAALFLPFAIVSPYLQKLLSLRGFDEQEIGIIQGTLEVVAVLAPPLWGYLADRTQRPRLALLIAATGAIPAFLLFAVTRQFWGALLVSLLFGFFSRPQIPLTDGLTFRYLHQHGGNYGMVRVGGSVSFIVAMVALSALGIGSRGVSLILGGMVVCGVLHVASIAALPADAPVPTPAGTRPTTDWRVFATWGFCGFVLAAFLGRVAMMSYYAFFTLYLEDVLHVKAPGYLWALGPLSEIPVIFFSQWIMRRIGVKAFFALGLAGTALRLFGLSLVTHVWQVVPLQFLHALTFGAYHTASVTYISRLTPVTMKSTAQTLFAGVTIGVGGFVGGAVGGWVIQSQGSVTKAAGYVALYRWFGLVALLALVLWVFLVPERQPAEPPRP